MLVPMRSPLSLDRLHGRSSPMAALLDAWRQARDERGMLPSRDDLAVGELLEGLDFTGWLHVAAPRPARFHFALGETAGATPLSGLAPVASHGDDLKAAARHLYDDLASAAFTGAALLHRVAHPDDPHMPEVARLILPFAGDGRHVDGLLVCGIAESPTATLH
ncbi:MAG: hypothetical protein JNK67_20380 [Alphaproteobacteria bacterium]|nr:hypothetical protein [Alphaproteobacteria bacterium]